MIERMMVPIALFGTIFGIVYVLLMTRNKERMALIEKGVDASLFYSKENKQFDWSKFTLKIGMVFMGIALGIIADGFLAKIDFLSKNGVRPAMVFFFGGLSLVLFYLFDKKSK